MRVLMISTDRQIFKSGSSVNLRMKKYAELFDQLDIIIFSKTNFPKKVKISENSNAYSTQSGFRMFYISDAKRIGLELGEYDVVTTQDPFETAMVGTYLKQKTGAKLNIQIHTDFRSPYFQNTTLNKFRVKVAENNLPQADSIRVVSDRIKRTISEISNVHVLSIRTDTTKLQSIEKVFKSRFENTILTVSRLEKEKNIETLLRALKIVSVSRNDVGLIIVGDGRCLVKLRFLTKFLKLSDKVLFVGSQKNPAKYYQAADIYAQASLYEGFGLALYEAAFSKLPIVTTDVGLIGDVISNDNVLIADHKSPESFAKKILSLLNDKPRAKKLGQQAYLDVMKSQLTEEKYLEEYKKILI